MKATSTNNMSLRGSKKNEGLPVFRTGGGGRRGVDGKVAAETAGDTAKRLQRKPPVPTAAAATAATAAVAQAAVGARSASSARDKSLGRDRVSPVSRGARGGISPARRGTAAERRAKETQQPTFDDDDDDGDSGVGVVDTGRSVSRGSDRQHLLLMLRQAVEEMEGLRQNVASADRERAVWKQRDDDVCLEVSRLEDRCEALESSVRAESDAAKAEAGRANAAEERFARLLVWAREEEERRLQAEEKLRRACEVGKALDERRKALKEEARQSKRQLEERRFKLEGALEDLRNRTSENERLEMQATTVTGQVEALRELADARELEVKEQREKLARLVEEAKGMSSENVSLRKHMSSEQERWRAAERSRAKQDERRRMELEQKCEDLHALRYRVQELEARLSREAARRHGAEEDARRSQEMERRSMEELMEGRKAAGPVRTGIGLAQSYPPHFSDPAATASGGQQVPATDNTWSHLGNQGSMARGVAPTTAAMISGGARSSTMSDVFYSGSRYPRDNDEHPSYHSHSADVWLRQETASTTHRDHPAAAAAAAATTVAGENFHTTPSTSLEPPRPGYPPPPIPPAPTLSASSLRESLRRPGGQRPPSPAAAAAAEPNPSLRPRPHGVSPVGLGGRRVRLAERCVGFDDDGHQQEVRRRPQPRRPPSEASSSSGGGRCDQGGEADGDGRSTQCSGGSKEDIGEWWAGGSPRQQGVNGKSSLDGESSAGVDEEGYPRRQDAPLHVVSL